MANEWVCLTEQHNSSILVQGALKPEQGRLAVGVSVVVTLEGTGPAGEGLSAWKGCPLLALDRPESGRT